MKHSHNKTCLRIAFVIAVFIVISGLLNAVNSSFEIISYGDDFTEIRFTLQEYELIPIEIDGVKYYRLFHPDAGFIAEEGFPELLTFSAMLSIPSTGSVMAGQPFDIKYETEKGLNIFPSQGLNLEIDEGKGLIKDEQFYEKDKIFGGELVQISSPAIMRDERLINITINPFSYNPARQELSRVTSLNLTINYDLNTPGENELRTNRRRSEAFHRIFRNSVLNYGQFRNPGGTRQDFQTPHIVMVYHNSDAFVPLVNQLADWKRDKGYQVTIRSNAGINSITGIRNYLRDAYNNWENRPEYVILIGGFPEIPTQNGDNPYTLLEGNDNLPDVILGRIPSSSATQLATVLNKIRNYERTPFMGNTTWYNNAILIGDRYASSLNIGKYVRDVMYNYSSRKTFNEHYSVGGSTNFAAQINNGINQGSSYFMYRGYLGMSGWSPSDAALNNGYRMFHGTFITCGTLNATASNRGVDAVNLGTPTQGKGAITTIGMFTGGTNSAQNNAIQAALYYGIFVEDLQTMGEALVRAKLHLWNVYSNSYPAPMNSHILWSTLIGDPSMYVWREIPKELNVDYPEELPEGSNSIRFVVTDNDDEPVEGAWVTIRQGDDDIFATGYTDGSGAITHFFPSSSEGTIGVTVTKFDYKPHLGSFDINEDEQAVSYHQLIAEDDFIAGEQVAFGLTIKNHQNQQVTGVSGAISTTSEYVNITSNTSGYGNINAGATANSIANYSVTISPDTPGFYKAEILLTVTDEAENSWLSRFLLPIQNGRLELVELVIDDGNNGILEPGEQAFLRFRLRNTGEMNLTGINARLSGGGTGFGITDSTAFYGNIAVGQSVISNNNHIEVSLSAYVIPGTIYNVVLEIYNENGFSQKIHHKIEIGVISVTDPLGPDEYGYWCFDEGDEDYPDVAEYNWIEIVPANGGNGTNTGLQTDFNNVQRTMTMDLPFTFRFYGEDYDIISICANGWVSFKEMEEATQRNWRIPGPKVPMPVIAVFWDNLSLAQGGVFTYFDEDNAKFIVQWENTLSFETNNTFETFQLILYDPTRYPTLTLDSPFKMQYRVFNNVNNNADGRPYGEWGNYATVGIADHTGKVGLEYTFNNRYPTAARPLGNESALYWTTGLSSVFVTIESFSFTDDNNNQPEYGGTGHINVTLANIGIEDGENVEAVLSTEDPYITITQNRAEFGNIPAGNFSTVNNAYSIQIADNVPHNHRATMNLSISAEDNNFWDDSFQLRINAPEISSITPIVYDPEPGGNNNGLIDPGEQLILFLPLVNQGGAMSPELSIEVTSDNDLAAITAISETEFISMGAGEIFYPALSVTVSEDAESGDRLQFSYTVETGNYLFEGQAVLGVGGLIPIQIGEGNAVSGPNDGSPINIYFRSLRSQTVYTTDELEEAGMTLGLPMPITRFGYYVAGAPAHQLPNFTVRMKHTNAGDVSAHDEGQFETVYQVQNYSPVSGSWDMLVLDQPFEWNGTHNILVDTSFSPAASWNSSGQVRIFEQANGFRYTRADSPPQHDQETDTVTSTKPQILMMMGTDPEAAALKPQNLSYEFDGQNVNLEWNPPQGRSESRRTRKINNRAFASDEYRNPDGYNIYRNGMRINDELVDNTEYSDSGFDPYRVNYYYVTAIYEESETVPSNVIAVIPDVVDKPAVSAEEGLYREPFNVYLTTETEETSIYYTLDGSEPTSDDYLYEEFILIDRNTELRAKAFKEGWVPSKTASAQYFVIYPPKEVSSSVAGSSVTVSWNEPWSPEERRLSDSRRRLAGHSSYTRNNTLLRNNIEGYNVYRKTGQTDFTRMNEDLIDDFEYIDRDLDSAIYHYYVTAVYELGESSPSQIVVAYLGITAPPVFSPEPGEYDTPVQIAITSSTEGAAIYYTTDNSEPDRDSYLYDGTPVELIETTTLKAIAYFDGWEDSEVTVGQYIIETTSADEEYQPEIRTQLYSAYPNPFNPQTTIRFDLRAGGRTKLEIYNITGRKVRTAVDDYLQAGNHSFIWQGDNDRGGKVGSGIYFYRLTAGEYTEVRRVVLLK